MPRGILNENWTLYDNRKLMSGSDKNRFYCDQEWEVDFLIGRVRRHYPQYMPQQIREAILACKRSSGKLRKEFIERVIAQLTARD